MSRENFHWRSEFAGWAGGSVKPRWSETSWMPEPESWGKRDGPGGRFNIYGRWLSTREFDIPSILAQCVQAVEMRLLSPVIDLAETHGGKSGFSLLLWQHDGFAFTAHKRENASHWVARLQGAVAEHGASMGYEAVLEQA